MTNNITPIIRQLFSSYPHAQASDGTIAQYIRLLATIPAEALQTVVDQAVVDCKFLPTIAEIFERYRALSGGLNEATAAEGWGSVEKAIRRVTRYGTPRFKDPLVARVVEMMGWLNLCNSEQPAVDRAQFMRMYNEIAEREQKIARLTPQARAMLEANTPAHKLISVDGMAAPNGRLTDATRN